jgi:hypothetical protein
MKPKPTMGIAALIAKIRSWDVVGDSVVDELHLLAQRVLFRFKITENGEYDPGGTEKIRRAMIGGIMVVVRIGSAQCMRISNLSVMPKKLSGKQDTNSARGSH